MPVRQFTRSRKAWYDAINQTDSQPEEFMLSFGFQEGEAFDPALDGEIALRYRPDVSGWRLEAFDDSLLLVSHFNDILQALAAKDARYDGDGLENLLKKSGVLDTTARTVPKHLKSSPLVKP